MARITQVVKNIIAGISQQPAILRHMEQLEEQENGFSTEADGLQKRPPSLHVNFLDDIPSGSKIHFINRDSNERYVVAFTGTDIKVWDINGNPKTVKFEEADTSVFPTNRQYLSTANPREDLKVITIADYSFIINRNITTQMNPTVANPNWKNNQGLLINVKQGQYGRKYEVIVNGNRVAYYETPDGSQASHSTQIDTNNICNQLANSIQGWSVVRGESWLYITGQQINSFEVRDGFNNTAMRAFHDTAQKFTDLPYSAPNGFTVLIRGEGSTDDDYYVMYSSEDKVWKETIKPDITTNIYWETMPHALIRNADGTFSFKSLPWSGREVGDEDSNPEPSFVGKKINDIFFFRNRLGLIAGEAVVLSRSGDYFNFWVSSATAIEDTDPIDLNVSHNRVSILYHAVPFNQDLYLFSESTQFILRADGTLSPKNAVINQVTEFTSNIRVKPIGVGRNLYFTSERSGFTTVREYYAVYDSSTAKDSTEITSHVPNYLKNHIYELIASGNDNILMALSSGDTKSLYVYKYLFMQDTKVQSSWSKWTFDGAILGADFIDSTLYIVINRGNKICLERLLLTYNTLDFDEEPYRCMMDRKQFKTLSEHSAYDERTGTFIWNGAEAFNNVQSDKYLLVFQDGRVFISNSEGKIIIKDGTDYSNEKAFIGVAYDFKIVFTPFYVKQVDQQGTNALADYRVTIQNVQLNYSETGYIDAYVETVGKPKRSYRMTSRILGYATNKLGEHPIETGVFRIPVHGKNTETKITVSNTSPLPSALIGYKWEGNMTQRFRQI